MDNFTSQPIDKSYTSEFTFDVLGITPNHLGK